jgi:urease accessory protein
VKINNYWTRALFASTCLSLVATVSQAHTGHGTSGLMEGVAHPFGLDHLLAMVAVGIWSVSNLPANRAWWGPATFMVSLVISAIIGTKGVTLPYLENMISLSVVMFGLMLVFAGYKKPTGFSLALIAIAAALHGLAHGAESPETGFALYAIGFLIATAFLHFGGVVASLAIQRYLPSKEKFLSTFVGVIFGSAGIYLFSQI